ncbi:MAG: hypothetical protein AAFX81_02270 [Pseudomonadota bacterium]
MMPAHLLVAGWWFPSTLIRLHIEMAALAGGAPVVIGQRMAKVGREWFEPGSLSDRERLRTAGERSTPAAFCIGKRQARSPAASTSARLSRALRPYRQRIAKNVRRLQR